MCLCSATTSRAEPGEGRALHVGAPGAAALSNDGLRCGRRLVSIGDTKLEVRERCGKPAYEETRYESREGPEGRTEWVRVDEWSYRLGSRRFIRVVSFEHGQVTAIRAVGYSR